MRSHVAAPVASASPEGSALLDCVKEETGLCIWPKDPFASAVVHIDEDAERDVREAQQNATPVALASEAGGTIPC